MKLVLKPPFGRNSLIVLHCITENITIGRLFHRYGMENNFFDISNAWPFFSRKVIRLKWPMIKNVCLAEKDQISRSFKLCLTNNTRVYAMDTSYT